MDKILTEYRVKPLSNANAMAGARLCRYSTGFADSLIGAQCLEGGFFLVTTNASDFARMPGIRLARL